jgi:putative ABC transport system permease protein
MIRNLFNHKTYSFINVLGLAAGLTCTILILLWVRDELSVDRYHKNGDRIAQVYLKGIQGDNTSFQPTVSPAISKMLSDEYPGIINTVRLGGLQEVVLKNKNKMIVESEGAAADPSIFSVFSYQFTEGDPKTALDNPHSIVITESTARKYFGNENPLGKILIMDNKFDLQVTGVIKDLPANSYRKFNFIVPFIFLKELGFDIIGTPFFPCSYLTYVLLKNNVDINTLSEKISKRIFAKGREITFEITLVPFQDVYFFDTGGKTKSTILVLISLFILGIACINFVNLSTARSMIRVKEIGIRKATGATRIEIAKQFLFESILLAFIAGGLAIVLVELSLSYFNRLTGKILAINLEDPVSIAGFIGLILLTGLAAGIYPALYLSKFNPIRIFRTNAANKAKGSYRQALIVFQFVLSIFFIICTIILSLQAHYIRNFNWGINKNNIVYVRMDGDVVNKYNSVKNELLKNTNILSVTSASNLPVNVTSGSYWKWGKNDGIGRRICPIYVDYDFLKTFDIKMTQGRFYSKSFLTDTSNAIIVNEAAIKKIDLKNSIGNPFYFSNRNYTLIGIMRDYQHNTPLHIKTEPMVFWLKPGGNEYLFAKINPNLKNIETITAAVNYINSICNRFSTERPLNTQFLSEFSSDAENNLRTMNQLVLISSILMIFVACLGLYGLTSFINEHKTKEIGVRKVLGASVSGIIIMLSKEFFKWVLLANIIAWPLAYIVMKPVLEDFTYRISISVWIFAAAGFFVLLTAMLTISWQAVKAATANPVESLRYE